MRDDLKNIASFTKKMPISSDFLRNVVAPKNSDAVKTRSLEVIEQDLFRADTRPKLLGLSTLMYVKSGLN